MLPGGNFSCDVSGGQVRVWCKQHEDMDPSLLCGGGSLLMWSWIFFFGHFGPLRPIEHHLNTPAYLSIIADHGQLFITTVDPSAGGYFQQDNAACHITQKCAMNNQGNYEGKWGSSLLLAVCTEYSSRWVYITNNYSVQQKGNTWGITFRHFKKKYFLRKLCLPHAQTNISRWL